MRWIKRILILLVVIVLALLAVSYVLPQSAIVTRTVTIDAPPEAIFPHLNSMQSSEAWSPWLSRDPDTRLTYGGPEQGVGNKMTWASDNPQVGTGTQEIVESVQNQSIRTALDFGPMGTATASFDLLPVGDATDVTWGFETDLGMNPMARWMGLMMDKWVGADYEAGLANLKALVEQES